MPAHREASKSENVILKFHWRLKEGPVSKTSWSGIGHRASGMGHGASGIASGSGSGIGNTSQTRFLCTKTQTDSQKSVWRTDADGQAQTASKHMHIFSLAHSSKSPEVLFTGKHQKQHTVSQSHGVKSSSINKHLGITKMGRFSTILLLALLAAVYEMSHGYLKSTGNVVAPKILSLRSSRVMRSYMFEEDNSNTEEDPLQEPPLKKLSRPKISSSMQKGDKAEVIIGRLAMFSFALLIFNEFLSGESFMQQFQDYQMHQQTSLAFLSSVFAVSVSRGLESLGR
jgi:hypothetical protein